MITLTDSLRLRAFVVGAFGDPPFFSFKPLEKWTECVCSKENRYHEPECPEHTTCRPCEYGSLCGGCDDCIAQQVAYYSSKKP